MTDIKGFEPLWGVWRTEQLLGSGSFGKVYRAVREDFGERYYAAIKHISVPADEAQLKAAVTEGFGSTNDELRGFFDKLAQGFISEIKLMNEVKGKTNIVSYEDHLVVPKPDGIGCDIFIRMELLTGLDDVIGKRQLERDEVIRLGVDICTALEVCAAKKIIHRDVKPSNIFVSDSGDYKLGDFGVARELSATAAMSKKGTYAYMAPEIYRGEASDLSADIYSLGIVMYRLLNGGRAPFLPPSGTVSPEENEIALARRMAGEPLPPPAYADPTLAGAILTATQHDRSKRFFSPTALKNALGGLSGAAIPAPSAQPYRQTDTVFTKGQSAAQPRSAFDATTPLFGQTKAEESYPEQTVFTRAAYGSAGAGATEYVGWQAPAAVPGGKEEKPFRVSGIVEVVLWGLVALWSVYTTYRLDVSYTIKHLFDSYFVERFSENPPLAILSVLAQIASCFVFVFCVIACPILIYRFNRSQYTVSPLLLDNAALGKQFSSLRVLAVTIAFCNTVSRLDFFIGSLSYYFEYSNDHYVYSDVYSDSSVSVWDFVILPFVIFVFPLLLTVASALAPKDVDEYLLLNRSGSLMSEPYRSRQMKFIVSKNLVKASLVVFPLALYAFIRFGSFAYALFLALPFISLYLSYFRARAILKARSKA